MDELQHLIFKREAEEGGNVVVDKIKDVGHTIKEKEEEAVDFVVDKTGMKPWMVITIVAVIFVAILAGIGWCIYR